MWTDLTVERAEQLRDFYKDVVGWSNSDHEMGGYQDFSMQAGDDQVVAGICHARGENADLPPQWLIYITVEDLHQSIERCRLLGGAVINGPRGMGGGMCAVIRDPAGAVAALFQPQ